MTAIWGFFSYSQRKIEDKGRPQVISEFSFFILNHASIFESVIFVHTIIGKRLFFHHNVPQLSQYSEKHHLGNTHIQQQKQRVTIRTQSKA
mmetsp:Transcript_22377/g.48164  ORF Transcript_22377/g.48164 Transcript_22377/m.48164 type:complete len:91 (-) Transcript_22377:693-965(-)